eukprot:712241_1
MIHESGMKNQWLTEYKTLKKQIDPMWTQSKCDVLSVPRITDQPITEQKHVQKETVETPKKKRSDKEEMSDSDEDIEMKQVTTEIDKNQSETHNEIKTKVTDQMWIIR